MKLSLLYEIAQAIDLEASGKAESETFRESIEQLRNTTREHSMNTIRLMAEQVILRFGNSAPAEAEMAG